MTESTPPPAVGGRRRRRRGGGGGSVVVRRRRGESPRTVRHRVRRYGCTCGTIISSRWHHQPPHRHVGFRWKEAFENTATYHGTHIFQDRFQRKVAGWSHWTFLKRHCGWSRTISTTCSSSSTTTTTTTSTTILTIYIGCDGGCHRRRFRYRKWKLDRIWLHDHHHINENQGFGKNLKIQ